MNSTIQEAEGDLEFIDNINFVTNDCLYINKSGLIQALNKARLIDREIPETAEFCIDNEEYPGCLLISMKENKTDLIRGDLGLGIHGYVVEGRFDHGKGEGWRVFSFPLDQIPIIDGEEQELEVDSPE